MVFARWARKELQPGDLSTLSELAKGSGWGDSNSASQLSRVCHKESKRQAERDPKGPRGLVGQAPFTVRRIVAAGSGFVTHALRYGIRSVGQKGTATWRLEYAFRTSQG
jgi:hypothetical protein